MRTLETIFSTTAWMAFLYFFHPLFTTFFWLLTGHWIQLHVLSYSTIDPTLDMLFRAILFSILILVILICWSSWNMWRYGGLDRRKSRPMVLDSTIASHFNISVETLTTARNAKLSLVMPVASGVLFTVLETNDSRTTSNQ